MLSDAGIRQYMKDGLVKVSPKSKIGPASIDLHIGSNLYKSNPQAHLLHDQEVERLGKMRMINDMLQKIEEPGLMSFDRYVSRFAESVKDANGYWFLEPNRIYYAQTAETIETQRNVHAWIATRSSCARNGLRVEYSDNKLDRGEEFKGNPFLIVKTYGTRVKLPKKYAVCQMIIKYSRNLMDMELVNAMKNGDIHVSGNPVVAFGSVILTFHPKLLRYNGKTLNPAGDNRGCFDEIDISDGYILEPGRFYLGSTMEVVTIGKRHVGILDEVFGPCNKDSNISNKIFGPLYIGHNKPYFFSSNHIHLNAPYHWPGSKHQMTLEIFPTTAELIKIKAGYPACRLLIQELYPECESVYDSRYNGQEGPTVSNAHIKI